MGNPEAGSSDHQPRTEYEVQPQEHQYEAMATHDQDQFQPQAQPNDPLAQQQFQPPPVAQPQQQQTQYPPPQTNQAYGAQPALPVQYPPQNNPVYPNKLNQPGAYPQQAPQTVPVQPVQFPPASPQMNQTYPNGQNQQPGGYPQYGQQPMPAHQTPVNYPPPQPAQYGSVGIPVQSQEKAWTSGLFDCMNDPMNALITVLFPCLTFGQLAEIVDGGHTSCGTSGMLYGGIAFCIGLPCIMSCTYRTKLRNKFGLPEAPAPDWITHFLCEWCALCQEYRELQARGWDPSIGWHGNLARNQNLNMQQVNMTPPMNQRMMG